MVQTFVIPATWKAKLAESQAQGQCGQLSDTLMQDKTLKMKQKRVRDIA